jgi:hypothetical protein
LPPLAAFTLRNGGQERMLSQCKTGMSLYAFLQACAPLEHGWLCSIEQSRLKARRHGPDLLPSTYADMERSVQLSVPGWRWRYYAVLFNIYDEAGIARLCKDYWKAMEWVLDYYAQHTDCLSWTHYYPWADAPLIADLVRYGSEDPSFTWTGGQVAPTVAQQLDYILPPRSRVVCGLPAGGQQLRADGFRGTFFRKFTWECKPALEVQPVVVHG